MTELKIFLDITQTYIQQYDFLLKIIVSLHLIEFLFIAFKFYNHKKECGLTNDNDVLKKNNINDNSSEDYKENIISNKLFKGVEFIYQIVTFVIYAIYFTKAPIIMGICIFISLIYFYFKLNSFKVKMILKKHNVKY